MRHPQLHLLGTRPAQAEAVDGGAVGVVEEGHGLAQRVAVDEAQRLRIQVPARHHVQDLYVRHRLQRLPQLHEPRLGVGSPVEAALEGEHDAVTAEVLEPNRPALEVEGR
jgi:hypothetical protein